MFLFLHSFKLILIYRPTNVQIYKIYVYLFFFFVPFSLSHQIFIEIIIIYNLFNACNHFVFIEHSIATVENLMRKINALTIFFLDGQFCFLFCIWNDVLSKEWLFKFLFIFFFFSFWELHSKTVKRKKKTKVNHLHFLVMSDMKLKWVELLRRCWSMVFASIAG